ncbi:RNA polymerase sigma factor [Hasllibacter sp. MH4015]|uniref:RNA polymerase sigma factor n=1 Tax=Hasllibacter sp. MH4015 TaxID=2854029 RepID=UPI001CD60CF3|nr:RNA polymerase sigma factor [Hasllibacter sp. MH4015]
MNRVDQHAEDWALLARAARDPAALTLLYERHRHYVFRVAWGILGEDAAADDVVQEVFLRIHDGRMRADPRARLTTWLYRVAINSAREQARKRRRVWGDAQAHDVLATIADPTADPTRLDRLRDLGRALAALPLRQREVVVLRYFEGFDTAETAEILGCRQGTVKAHLHRATRTLKNQATSPMKQEKLT